MASAVCLLPLSAPEPLALAQPKPGAAGKPAKPDAKKDDKAAKGKGKPGDKNQPVEVDLDDPGTKKDDDAPAVAGQMSEEAATAKKLFEAEKWGEAALQLNRVFKGETGDDKGNQQIAQYELAVSLYRLQFYQASYGIFSQIADKPNHLKFNETLLWLAKLATQLPEPADIVERVGKYSDEQVARFNNKDQKELYWQLNYLLGRYKYREKKYQEAIQLFEKVEGQSKFYVQSQFFNGISYAQLKKAVPAVDSFMRIVKAVDSGAAAGEDSQRMRDLAYLSMARTFYSSSVSLDTKTNAPTVDEQRLSAAVKYWNLIDTGSEYWLDGLFEESWAYFMAGDYPRALGNIHTIQSPFFPSSFYPEADILRAQIYFQTCQYDYALIIVGQFLKKYQPVQTQLEKILEKFGKEGNEEEAFKFLQDVVAKKADLPVEVKYIVELALSDRQLLRNLEYVKVLTDEEARFKKQAQSFQESSLGNDVRDALDLAKSVAVKSAGAQVVDRYQRNLDELSDLVGKALAIRADSTGEKRVKLEQMVESAMFTEEDAETFGVVNPDDEHVLWPFDGEFWRDELGFYRQVVESKCKKR